MLQSLLQSGNAMHKRRYSHVYPTPVGIIRSVLGDLLASSSKTQDVPTEQADEGQGPTREGQQPLSFWSFQKPKDPALRSPSMSLGGHLQKGKCLAQQGGSQHSWRS